MALCASLLNLPAPAKINRFLHIVGRRPDGYHLLESVFELLSLADSVSLEEDPSGKITRKGDMADIPNDLCVRAAKLLKEKTGCEKGAVITVKKRIPAGAGLGGGSSDAATALIGLSRLWNLGLSRAALSEYGMALGADVPFFIGGHNAFVEGIGERLTPVTLPEEHFAVIWPGVGSATEKAFKDPHLTRNTQSLTIDGLCSSISEKAFPADLGHNDLEPVIRRAIPEVDQAVRHLSKFGFARMTGSGSAVFVPAESEEDALRAVSGLPEGWRGFAAKSLSVHPLSAWFAD